MKQVNKVLVVNCGSSSLKFQLFDMKGEKMLCKGLVERIGIAGSRLVYTKTGCEKITEIQTTGQSGFFKVVLTK